MAAVGRSRTWVATAAASLVVAAGLTPSPAAAAPTATTVELVSGVTHIDVERFGHRPALSLPEAVYVAATGGDFRIDASRRNGHVRLLQVTASRRDPQPVRRIRPLGPVRMSHGLPGFLTVSLRNAAGDLVATARTDFCPAAGYDAQRIDADSPTNPTYPTSCGDGLTHATVWGINQGWAVPVYPTLKASRSAAPDGTYQLTIRITAAYARQLDIPPAASSRTLTVHLTTDTSGPCGDAICANTRPGAPSEGAVDDQPARSRRALARSDAPGQGGMPDLAALPARDLTIEHRNRSGRDYLGFAATIWNRGPGTFDVEGFRRGHQKTMVAKQYTGRRGHLRHPVTIGRFEFDTRHGHDHWHLRDVARYDLLDRDGNRVVLSHKQSFCLAPTDPIDLLRTGAEWNPDNVGLSSACPTEQSLWLRETLPTGWGDTYVQSVGGQAFDITNVPNGRYLIRITANPHGRIEELSRSNDSALLGIRLGGRPGDRTVRTIGPVPAR